MSFSTELRMVALPRQPLVAKPKGVVEKTPTLDESLDPIL